MGPSEIKDMKNCSKRGLSIEIKTQNPPGENLLMPDLNRVPDGLRNIYLMGICGTGMASLAGMLKEKGYRVTGSDQGFYPPMSEFLAGLSIPVLEGSSRRPS